MDNSRKNRWRRQEFLKVREQRVITGYVQKKYPEVYKEAEKFYKFLNEKYPTKKDLRRTNEYEWIKTGISGETTKKYYKRKGCPNVNKRTTTEEHGDNMRLVIPLMTHTTTETSQPTSVNDEQPPVELVETVIGTNSFETSVNDEQPPVELVETVIGTNSFETSVNDEQPPVELAETVIGTNSFETSVNDEIPDSIINEIMANLRQDPYLEDFFSTMDIEFDETSPLERELALYK